MRAVVVTEHGGPEVLTAQDVEAPTPGAGEVLVDVAACGVNYVDVYRRTGLYPAPVPYVAGLEGAGRVTAVGADVHDLREGDAVGWVGVPGSYAERVAVPAGQAFPLPDGTDPETAAAVLLQGMTAHYLTHATYPVQPGDSVLVHAAAGGTGLLICQLARRRGARVIGTVSTAEKAAVARAAGADEIIDYTVTDVAERVRELTGGTGVAAVYDGVGRSTFDGSLASLRPRGVLALYGQSSGPVPPVDPARLNAAGSVYLTRPALGHYTATRAERLDRARDVLGGVADGTISVRIGGRYPLDAARTAHEDLEARRTTGKLLLLP